MNKKNDKENKREKIKRDKDEEGLEYTKITGD